MRFGERPQAFHAGLGDDDDLAVLDVAHEARADDVERAGLGRQHVVAVELAQDEGTDAERVAGSDQRLVGEGDEGVGALQLAQRLDEALDDARLAAAGDEVEDHLGVGGRLVDGAVADQLAAQRQAVGEVAVVGDGDAAGVELGEQRLHVAQDRLAGRRVAHVADGGGARQPGDGRGLGEMVADEPRRRSELKRWPSKATMPAASWPRCCKACRPSAVIAAASGCPKMPKTPHSSRRRSASGSKAGSAVSIRWGLVAGSVVDHLNLGG